MDANFDQFNHFFHSHLLTQFGAEDQLTEREYQPPLEWFVQQNPGLGIISPLE